MDNELLVYIMGTLNAILGIAITVILRIVNKHYGIETSDIMFKLKDMNNKENSK